MSLSDQYPLFSGEKLTKEEVKGLMKELCDPEDDEGFMPFMRKHTNNWGYVTRSNILFIHSFPGENVQQRIGNHHT